MPGATFLFLLPAVSHVNSFVWWCSYLLCAVPCAAAVVSGN
jgi:hypothetical protein